MRTPPGRTDRPETSAAALRRVWSRADGAESRADGCAVLAATHAAAPSVAAYLPAAHAVHAATFDAVEYLPTAHAVQILAPVLVPAFVIEPAAHALQSLTSFDPVVPVYVPAAQAVHGATFDAVEYLPTAHAVHVVAPVLVPASVIEPAAQFVQVACPAVA